MDPRIQEIMNQLNQKAVSESLVSVEKEATPSPPKPPTTYEEYLEFENLVRSVLCTFCFSTTASSH